MLNFITQFLLKIFNIFRVVSKKSDYIYCRFIYAISRIYECGNCCHLASIWYCEFLGKITITVSLHLNPVKYINADKPADKCTGRAPIGEKTFRQNLFAVL